MSTELKEIKIDERGEIKFPSGAINDLYGRIKSLVSGEKLNTSNIIFITTSAMIIVENYKNINGVQKRDLILYVLNLLIEDTIDKNDQQQLKNIVKFTLPNVIDTIISIDKKEIQIKIQKGCKKLFSCC